MATITVREYQRAVRLVDGRVRDVLEPGRYRYRPGRTEIVRVDTRSRMLTVPGQEVLTGDGVSVRATVVARVAVTDPVAHLTASQDGPAEVYAALQQALRRAVAQLRLEALVAGGAGLGPELSTEVTAAATRVGLAVEETAVRDVMLPGELRRAFAETALARERGRAELERARAEAATMRSLVNTARLLEEHPALLKLRTLRVAEQEGTELRLTA